MKTDAAPWDMAIIGAGPAGSVCACSALAVSDRMCVALIKRRNINMKTWALTGSIDKESRP